MARGGATMAVLLAISGLTAGCATVHPTLDDLRAVPGATLQYPGSVEIVSGDRESEQNLVAKNGAVLKSYRCTDSPRESWAAWFEQQLAANGWELVHNPMFGAQGDSVLVGEWRRDDHLFDLYDLSPGLLASLEQQHGGDASCSGGYETLMH